MIKIDIPMPDVCGECRFIDNDREYPYCLALGQDRGYPFDVNKKKFPNCPLKLVEKEDESELSRRKDMCRVLFNRCVALTHGAMCIWCGIRKECEQDRSMGRSQKE